MSVGTGGRRGVSRARGATLIEVLVSLVLLSVGVIGMAVLHGRAAQFASNAEDRNRAAQLADDLIAQMWAAQTTGVSNNVLRAWRDRLANERVSGLPHANATIGAADADGLRSITITWYPVTRDADHAYEYTTKVVLP